LELNPSVPAAYFDELYAKDPDPWDFASSDYEAAKYADTLANLPDRRFVSALEVGCSIGVLTQSLAERCDRLLAIDVAEAALTAARDRCAGLAGVTFEKRRIPEAWPDGKFDLILFSEVLYYLSKAEIRDTARIARHSLIPGGAVVLVHWSGDTGGTITGDQALDCFLDGWGSDLTAKTVLARGCYMLAVIETDLKQ